ncbi:hypothetical protein JDV02_007758 [Purpureocillium takamizusanense]|uniref:Uncharacterized protein n=1 Tax=Purpureocillium takamizusanense TaxID=2060973 RepID=A0A9Q8QNS2_9HYPO|nr:uncharacterized protein JDV02_007758 [Purpureocillium takamizusanense]UNI21802.1 hypothetical protein JDV02_007758 [Purpureocillium takamizusanense]
MATQHEPGRPEQGLTPWPMTDPWAASSFDWTGNLQDGVILQGASLPRVSVLDVDQSAAAFNKSTLWPQSPKIMRDKSQIKEYRNMELHILHNAEFELQHGDTIVFVDLPSTLKDSWRKTDCDGVPFASTQKFRVHSQRLLATGSSKFAELLGPTYQFRIQRRRKMVNKMPPGVKFLIDLTPPSEGDELVFQMTELSLTPGIMSWWSSNKLYDTDPSLVSGHDDVCSCRHLSRAPDVDSDDEFFGDLKPAITAGNVSAPETYDETIHGGRKPGIYQIMPDTLFNLKLLGETDRYKTPAFRQIPDYCPIRHRNAIIRLLFIIEDRDVLIDSASRVWTLLGLAKMFDCVAVIRDRIVQWFMHGNNIKFIEVLPEEALRIGFALENMQITQNAFRILVNELALQDAASDEAKRASPRTTIFGRRTGDCTDEHSNLIQHAARTLVDRISTLKDQLQSPDLFNVWHIAEWEKLRRLEVLLAKGDTPSCPMALALLRVLMDALPTAVNEIVRRILSQPITEKRYTFRSMDVDRATYMLPQDYESLESIVLRMNDTQKLLCPFFYNELGETCSWHLYLGAHAKKTGIPYQSLVKELDIILGNVTREQPAIMRTAECAEFVRPYDTSSRSTVYHFLPVLDLDRLDWQVKDALQPITVSWIRHDVDPPLNLTRHMLLTMSMNELKFLPLWAGGFDDGTGGVFESYVPPTDMGPNGPGPAYHTGCTLPSAPASISESMIEEMSAMRFKGSTIAGSVDVHDSISTVYKPDEVIADEVTLASESFTMAGSEYQEAQFAVPAAHQGVGQALEMMVDSDSGTDAHDASTADGESTASSGAWGRRDDTVGPYSEDSDGDSDSEGSLVMV